MTKETQKNSRAGMPDPMPGGSGRKSQTPGVGAPNVTARRENSSPEGMTLMEAVVARKNMMQAYGQVVRIQIG